MAMATQNKTLDRRETASLIGSDKVEGTPVYRSNGDRVGQVERVMIDKLSGKVAYAVMSFAVSSASAKTTIRCLGRC